MKLFNLLFGCELEGTEKLFYQGGAAYDAERKSLRFQAGETASFETYFNLFPMRNTENTAGFKTRTSVSREREVFSRNFFAERSPGIPCRCKR